MIARIPAGFRIAFALVLLTLGFASGVEAATFSIYLNVDNNPGTGCGVSTADGPFQGAEYELTTTVQATGAASAEVSLIERKPCNLVTELFDLPPDFSAPGGNVGIGNGTESFNVVETRFPLNVANVQTPSAIRLAVTSSSGPGQDAMLVASAAGEPIVFNLQGGPGVEVIPTLSEWGLILLALLLAAAAALTLRRRSVAALLLALALLGAAGIVWAATSDLDGSTLGEWDPESATRRATDTAGDGPAGADIRAFFATADVANIYFRLDVSLLFNQGPTANPQSVTTNEDTPVVITLTGSDTDGDPLTFAIGTGPTNGTLSAITPVDATSAQVTYTPSADFNGADSFTFTVNDGTATSTPATVSLTVSPANDAPVANAQSVTTNEDASVVITLTGSDVDGDPLTFAIGAGPTNGTLSAITPVDATSAQVIYTPNTNYNGPDSFTFTASDGTATSPAATVSITVSSVNNTPVANPQSATTAEDTPVVITLTGSDVDGDPLTFAIGASPTNGTLSAITPVNATSAQVTYTPNTNFNGSDSFTFTAGDGTATSPAATVSLTVTAANDAPVANAQSVSVNEDAPLVITLTGSDVDGDSLTFAIGTGPTNGTLSAITPVNATSAQVTYTPNTDFNGADSFTFTVNDGTVTSPAATVSLTVTGVNDAPVANAQSASTNEDTPVVITLTGSDTEGSPLTFAIGTGPTNGTLSAITPVNATSAQVTYSPGANFNGADSFTFTVNDGTATSPAATVSLTITGVNDAPVANAQAVATNEDTPVVITLTGSDVDGDPLTFAIGTSPTNGTLSAITPINATSAQVTYSPGANFNGSDSFTFTVNDGTVISLAATVSITVNAVNDAPVANAQSVSTNEDTPVVITLTGSDVDGNPLTFAIGTGPTNGALSAITPVSPTSAQVTYTPGTNFNGPDSFTFTVNDGTVTSLAATVSITVNAVNDTPTANAQSVSTNEDTPVVITLTGSDIDGDPLSFAIGASPTNGALSAITPINATSAQVTYTPGTNFNGPDSFTFTVNDGAATSLAATVSITVNAVNDTPTANAQSVSTNEDTPVVITLTGSDIDGDSLSFAAASPTNGTLSAITPINATSAQVTYTPNLNFNGSDSFTFTVNDGAATSLPATVSITVNAVNDPPDAVTDLADIFEEAPNVAAANTVSGNVLANDIDPDSALTVSAVNASAALVGNPVAGTYGSVTINSNGSFTYTLDDTNPTVNALAPGQMLTDSFNYTASDGSLTDSSTLTVTIHGADDPATPDNDAFDFIGNTQLEVDRDTATTPKALATTPPTPAALGVLDGDIDPDGGPAISISGITGCGDTNAPFDCTLPGQGTVSLQADGSFSFVPEAGDADPTASFSYTLTGNPIAATVTLTRFQRVWYVNNADGGGTGVSNNPFDTLAQAQTASAANEYIFVHFGNGTSGGQSSGILLKNGQHLIGEFDGLRIAFNPAITFNGVAGTTSVTLLDTPPDDDCSGGPCRPLLDDTVAGAPEGVAATDAIPAEIVGLNLAGNVNGIDLTTNAAFAGSGTLEIRDNVIRSTGIEGMDINHVGSGSINLRIHDNNVTAGVRGIDVLRTGGPCTISSFANNVITGNTGGSGMEITGVVFDTIPGTPITQVTGGATLIGQSGNGVSTNGMVLTSVTGELTFTDLDIVNEAGTGLFVSSSGGLNAAAGTGFRIAVDPTASTIDSNGGPAVSVNNSAITLPLGFLRSTNSTTTGLSLVNAFGGVGATALSVSSGQISDPGGASGTAVNISGGSGNISLGIPITNTSGNAVAITGRASDTVAFTGAITETGSGISLTTNSGATMSFRGGLSATTGANPAFTATGGGIVEVCDDNPCNPGATGLSINTLSTTAGTALNVSNTTISSNNLEFRSISSGTAASGPANGIVLNSTGTTASFGGLKIKGTGAAGTGGTIQRSSAAGVMLTSTRDVSFSSVIIQNGSDDGIRGSSVTNFTMTNSTVSTNGDAVTERGLEFTNLLGTGNITGSTITGSAEDNLYVLNNVATPLSLTTSTTTYSNTSASVGNDGIHFLGNGSADMSISVTNCIFTNNRGDHFQATTDAASTATMDVIFRNNDLNNTVGTNLGAGLTLNPGGSASMTFDISNNGTAVDPFTGAFVSAITINSSNSSQMSGTIDNNIIGNPAVVDSGSFSGDGITVFANNTSQITVAVTSNLIRQYSNLSGINIHQRDGNGSINATVTGNTISNPGTFASNGLLAQAGSVAGDAGVLCVDIGGAGALANSLAGSGANGGTDFRVRQRINTTVRLPGYPGTATDTVNVVTHIQGRNTGAETGSATVGTVPPAGGFVGGAACLQPL